MKNILVVASLFCTTLIFAQSPFTNPVPEASLGQINAAAVKATVLNSKANAQYPYNVATYKLKNGLTVMLSENHETPSVYGMVMTKAGGKNDPKDATGLAHYLEHMLFKGTTTLGTTNYEMEKPFLDKINDLYEELGKTVDVEKRKEIQKQINEQSIKAGEYAIPNEFDKLIAQIGGTEMNAFTTEDFTAYFNKFPASQMERWLDLYSHRFEEPVFRLFQSELETVYEEKNRGNDSPFMHLYETYLKNFYKVHPYGQQPLIGETEHLKNPPLKKMYEYFNTYYVANNMALILAGDFEIEKIMPLIEVKFGDWRTGEIPKYPGYKEEPFKGREFMEVKYTPVKLGILGYRTPEKGHPDFEVVEVCQFLLSNMNQSGFIDKKMLDGKISMAQMFPVPYNDYGAAAVFFMPKIVGQSLEDAEAHVIDAVKQLRNGDFTDEFLESVKLNMLNERKRLYESNEERVMDMVEFFSVGKGSWETHMMELDKIRAIKKEEVLAAANKYFGDNFFMMYSKMGFPKNEKLDKPGFEPVIPKNEVKSIYAQEFDKLPKGSPNPAFVDFKTDVVKAQLAPGITMNAVKNPYNDLFRLEIRFGTGKYYDAKLKYLPMYMDVLGTDKYTATALKEEFFKYGGKYYFDVTNSTFSMFIEGPGESFNSLLSLSSHVLKNVKVDEEKLKKLKGDLESNKKLERAEPSYIAGALNEFVLYGNESQYLKDLSAKEIKTLTGPMLLDALKETMSYEMTLNYTGPELDNSHRTIMTESLVKGSVKPAQPFVVRQMKPIDASAVYVLNNKKAVQSQVWFNIQGPAHDVSQEPLVDAFNAYFGNDMSSLVFQEIREFRSLAYSSYARFMLPEVKGKDCRLIGFIGCQGDKTNEAVDAMLTLIRDMPKKPERMEALTSSLKEMAMSSKPTYNEMLGTMEKWHRMGYTADPNQVKLNAYDKITFDDVVKFEEQHLKSKPIVITVVGNKKRFDTKKFEQIGKVTAVSEKSLFAN